MATTNPNKINYQMDPDDFDIHGEARRAQRPVGSESQPGVMTRLGRESLPIKLAMGTVAAVGTVALLKGPAIGRGLEAGAHKVEAGITHVFPDDQPPVTEDSIKGSSPEEQNKLMDEEGGDKPK